MNGMAKYKLATIILGAILLGVIVHPLASAWVADNQRQEIEQLKIDARLAVACTDKTNEPEVCLRANNLEVRP